MFDDTLLVPTDGSDSAEQAASRAFDLAAQCGMAVEVIAVADSSLATGVGYSGEAPTMRERLAAAASERTERLAERASDRGLAASTVVRTGIPAEEITTYATEAAVDAIAMGTAGRSGLARSVIGSVADTVLRTAPVPVVTYTPAALETAAAEIESILVPTDGSQIATAATGQLLAVAEALDATVYLLTVRNTERRDALATMVGEGSNQQAWQERAQTHLDTMAVDAQDRGLSVETATREGTPAEKILDYRDEAGVDAIGMATAGRGGIDRALLGSVTDAVVRRAPVPVVTTAPKQGE